MLPISDTPYGASDIPWLGKSVVPEVVKTGPGGWSHGWIREGSPEHKEFSKLDSKSQSTITGHLDAAHEARTTGDHATASEHLLDASHSALAYGGKRAKKLRSSLGSASTAEAHAAAAKPRIRPRTLASEPVTAASASAHGKDVVDKLAAKVDPKDPHDDGLLRESSMMDEKDLQRGLEYLDNKDPSTYTDAERKVAQHLMSELHGDSYDVDEEEDY